jgi:exopolyphosphatase/pppGpp-phosphohydrolase
MRIALIEVGSNTIRYLVAGFGDEIDFTPEKIETVKHNVHPSHPTAESVDEVNAIVEEFAADARQRDTDRFLAYGTQACRTVDAKLPGKLAPLVRVLSPAEEAMASWVAGFACTSRKPGTRCTVIDEGSGSTEIVSATWTGGAVKDLAFFSVDVGSVALLEEYKSDAKGHLPRTTQRLGEMLPSLGAAGVASGDPGALYLVGGVATSIGWLASKKTGMQEYRPAEINGAVVTLSDLDKLYKGLARLMKTDPAAARRAVDTRRGSEDHVLKVLSSLPYLTLLSSYLQPSGTYYVSGYGVRHGMGFLIKNGLVGLDPAVEVK